MSIEANHLFGLPFNNYQISLLGEAPPEFVFFTSQLGTGDTHEIIEEFEEQLRLYETKDPKWAGTAACRAALQLAINGDYSQSLEMVKRGAELGYYEFGEVAWHQAKCISLDQLDRLEEAQTAADEWLATMKNIPNLGYWMQAWVCAGSIYRQIASRTYRNLDLSIRIPESEEQWNRGKAAAAQCLDCMIHVIFNDPDKHTWEKIDAQTAYRLAVVFGLTRMDLTLSDLKLVDNKVPGAEFIDLTDSKIALESLAERRNIALEANKRSADHRAAEFYYAKAMEIDINANSSFDFQLMQCLVQVERGMNLVDLYGLHDLRAVNRDAKKNDIDKVYTLLDQYDHFFEHLPDQASTEFQRDVYQYLKKKQQWVWIWLNLCEMQDKVERQESSSPPSNVKTTMKGSGCMVMILAVAAFVTAIVLVFL